MKQVAGLQYETDTQGKICKVAFDFREIHNNRIAEVIQDLIDGMEAEAVREEGIYSPLEDVLARQDEKRRIKDV
ncbi:MAG: hypothetical protein LBE91_04010 [Tannerella sp.]|jgi:hypothetical protein|nr:hypothetical protein [Tannerella sp.]